MCAVDAAGVPNGGYIRSVLQQDRVSEPPAGEHCVPGRCIETHAQTVPPPVREEKRMAGGMACG